MVTFQATPKGQEGGGSRGEGLGGGRGNGEHNGFEAAKRRVCPSKQTKRRGDVLVPEVEPGGVVENDARGDAVRQASCTDLGKEMGFGSRCVTQVGARSEFGFRNFPVTAQTGRPGAR